MLRHVEERRWDGRGQRPRNAQNIEKKKQAVSSFRANQGPMKRMWRHQFLSRAALASPSPPHGSLSEVERWIAVFFNLTEGEQGNRRDRRPGIWAGRRVNWSRCRCGRSSGRPMLAVSSLWLKAASLLVHLRPLSHQRSKVRSVTQLININISSCNEGTSVCRSDWLTHLARQTAAEPPGLQGTRKSLDLGRPGVAVYIFRSSSYSSSRGNSRSSSRWPGRRRQTEPAEGRSTNKPQGR